MKNYFDSGYAPPNYVVGSDTSNFLVSNTVLAQYANSPTIMQLIANMAQYIDPSADFDAFYSAVWNIDTAQGFGLDVWGRIVNISRQLAIPGAVTNLGFSEGGATYQPFGQASFYAGVPATQSYTLADPAYRTLILVKALANISSCTPRSLNQLLQNLFAGRGRCYVIDSGGMTMSYVFEFLLTPYELAILTQSTALPRPAAVSAQIVQIDVPNTFGFSEALVYQPFGYGVFFNPTTAITAVN